MSEPMVARPEGGRAGIAAVVCGGLLGFLMSPNRSGRRRRRANDLT